MDGLEFSSESCGPPAHSQMSKLRLREGRGLSRGYSEQKKLRPRLNSETWSSVSAPRHWGPQVSPSGRPDLNIFPQGNEEAP